MASTRLSRRDFVRLSALSLLGVACSQLLPGASTDDGPSPAPRPGAPTGKNLIYLYMSGGMSHLDTFDTKPGQAVQGPTQTISTAADGVSISEYFPLLAKQMKHVAVVRSLSSNQGAHEQGNYYMHTSYNLRGTVRHPALGSWLLNFSGRTNSTIPGNVVIGGDSNYPGNGYLDPRFAPILLGRATDGLKYSKRFNGVSETEFADRNAALAALNKSYADKLKSDGAKSYQDVYDEALSLMKSTDLQAFSIADEAKPIRDAYGDSPFGQGCLLARRLVEHGVALCRGRTSAGWDTHADNFDRVSDLSEVLDRGLSTLLEDLHQRGMLDETMVVVTTEFGRSPEITDNQGRNHHPRCFSGLLAGGGVRGGQVYGKTDATGSQVIENELSVPDFNATIAYGLGLPTATVVHSPSGRPFTIADKGRPALPIFG